MRKISFRRSQILDMLELEGPNTAAGLGARIGAPAASIRRNIQELRTKGWRIAFAGRQSGLFRLEGWTNPASLPTTPQAGA